MTTKLNGTTLTTMTVAEFLLRYYKPARYTGRGTEYTAALLASHQTDYQRDGYDIISHYDSVTGCIEYIGTPPSWLRVGTSHSCTSKINP